MHAIVGLGNPGAKYALTRHNIGFLVVDALAQEFGARSFKNEFKSQVARLRLEGSDELLLIKPQTFMNLSGEAVQAAMAFFKIPPDNLLVVHDEVDLPFGQIRLQKNRGHGGHNGVRDIHAKIGSDYARLRFGVGRPLQPQMEVADYVLQNFSKEELDRLPEFVGPAAEGVLSFVEDGFQKAQNKVNS